jgi:hypothetical protein
MAAEAFCDTTVYSGKIKIFYPERSLDDSCGHAAPECVVSGLGAWNNRCGEGPRPSDLL